jgi:antitoxin Phd
LIFTGKAVKMSEVPKTAKIVKSNRIIKGSLSSANRVPGSTSVTATQAKNEFGRLLERAIRGDVLVITKHDEPKAVLISAESFNSLSPKTESTIDTLTAEFDAVFERMQQPGARAAMKRAFRATPEQLAKAAVAAARKRG